MAEDKATFQTKILKKYILFVRFGRFTLLHVHIVTTADGIWSEKTLGVSVQNLMNWYNVGV